MESVGKTEYLNKHRNLWMEKARKRLDDIFMASLDQDSAMHSKLVEDLHTAVVIMWRHDRKLLEEREHGSTDE